MENKVKISEFKYWVQRKDDLEGGNYIGRKIKDKLPALSFKKNRSVTPEFVKVVEASRAMTDRLKKTGKNLNEKGNEKFVLPLEVEKIKEMTRSLNVEIYSYKDESIPGVGRSALIGLEKWLGEVLRDNFEEFETIFTLFVQELAKEVSMQSVNSAKLVVLLFVELQKAWKQKLEQGISEIKIKEREIYSQVLESLEKTQAEVDAFKSGMNEYIQKYRKADDKNSLLTRENDILKHVLTRLQQEYKLPPFNYTKVSELIIEDLTDISKRTQKRIVNTLAPKFCKNILVQTDETLIIQIFTKETQTQVYQLNKEVQASESVTEISVQTQKIKRKMGIFLQSSLKIFAKSNTFTIINRISKQKTKLTEKNIENNLKKFENLENSQKKVDFKVKVTQAAPKNFIQFSEIQDYFPISEPQTVLYKSLETLGPYLNNYPQKSKKNSLYSVSSTSSVSSIINPLIDPYEKYYSRPLTPPPKKYFSISKKSPKNPSLKALMVVEQCLKLNSKVLVLNSSMSVHTLLKTIESLFYSCLKKLRKNNFLSFLDHAYNRLGNKYSFRKVKEKRLQDLISSSVLYKDLLMSKLFLRSIGAGSLLGLSNYSVHTLRIILHLLSFFNSHIFGRPLFYHNERKMCQKSKALEIAKIIFKPKLENTEFIRVIQQIENHSEIDQQGVKGALIDIEWVIYYLVFTFDYYEKQVLEGVGKIMDAVVLGQSEHPSKGEFLMAVRSCYEDWENILNDRNSLRIFPFLSEMVADEMLIEHLLIEKFCLHCGIFKIKTVDKVREMAGDRVDELEIDELAFKLDAAGAGDSKGRERLQKKLYCVKESRDPGLAFVVYRKEVLRIIGE